MVAILFADLDHFKQINDMYGHHIGDQALVAAAVRLAGLVRPGDTLARLAGDEFVIVCEDLHDAAEVEALADRIGVALADAFVLSGTEIRITASVGIAFAGPGADIPEQILHDADRAMYEAKQRGRGRHHYVDRMRRGRFPPAGMRRDLVEAMASGELRHDYQPVVRSPDRRIVGVEALLRCPHPSGGALTSATVVALAEEHGMLAELERWALERSCLDRRTWLPPHEPTQLKLAVNISVRQLLAPHFADMVGEVLAQTSTDPGDVVLDVLESTFIRDPVEVATALRTLKDLGLLLALDNFGSGYSSLGHLRHFPIDILKLDRTFVTDLDRDPDSRIIAGSVIELAHRTGHDRGRRRRRVRSGGRGAHRPRRRHAARPPLRPPDADRRASPSSSPPPERVSGRATPRALPAGACGPPPRRRRRSAWRWSAGRSCAAARTPRRS